MIDVSAIQVEMEAQLLNIVERRKRRIEEESFRRRRADVEQHYNRLKSAGELVLPTLAEFRKLPTMQVVVGKVSSASLGVSTELKNSVLFGEMIREDLRKWMEPVRDILSHQLGAAQWKTASKTRLHPLDRITARFTCKKCDKVAKKYTADGCLDFRGVCSHQCPHLDKKAAESYVWSADQFVKDEKVTAVISQVLELCGADEQHRDASAIVHAVGPRFRCLTCKMLMDFRSVIGHAQRHDHMKVELVPNNESNPYTFQFGLSVKLLDLGRKAAKMRALQNYRCCHCAVQSAPRDVAATNVTSQASAIAPGDKAEPLRLQSAKEVKLFDFNALRSHVKAKHNIEHIRDEDFSCHSPLDWATSYPKLQSRDRRKI
ncbi:hypothetical protein BJ138DRAFT_129661 [Hygrophoropsis aurantiaca]|uniref:Uncharacterized protein n=1 Tax=Hygrophoropsis aurantiaca TaxID=72124 RepID=A0ACB8AAL1_9AGAM|nr:hypothetical protein BJ138DRAFT_129661 [Hygrophoropsis aurantiaca]